MAYLILFFFFSSCLFAYVEDLLPKKQQYLIYIFFGVCLILMCGFKEIGLDPDSENYEQSFLNYYADKTKEKVEFTFIAISAFLNLITDDAHILFLFYAIIGVSLKMYAFTKFNSKHIFLLLTAYLSYYYVVQDMMQIRTGVMTGLLLLAIKEIYDKRRWMALVYIIIGSCFHISGLLLLPFLFFKNTPFTKSAKYVWSLIVIFTLLLSAKGGNVMDVLQYIPYVGDKMSIYQKAADTGTSISTINGFGVFHVVSVLVFLYLMIMSKTLAAKDKYSPLLLRLYAVGLISYTLLGFIPDLGVRASHVFRIVTIMLIADIAYTIRPRWAGILCSQLVALFYLNYELQFIQFAFLWKTAGAN